MERARRVGIHAATRAANTIAQWAGVAALQGEQGFIAKHNAVFKDRRDLAVGILNQSPGLHCNRPRGAFYLYVSCGDLIGRHTPEAVGDYVAGPNHVLPTGRRARFASGLSVLDFMKRTSFLQADPAALAAIGPAAVALAEIEGLPAHAASVKVRL